MLINMFRAMSRKSCWNWCTLSAIPGALTNENRARSLICWRSATSKPVRFAAHLGPAPPPAARRMQGCKLHCRALDDPIPTAAAGQMKAGTSGAQSYGLTRVGPDSGAVPSDLSAILGLWIAAANPAFRLPRRIWGACNFVISAFVIC